MGGGATSKQQSAHTRSVTAQHPTRVRPDTDVKVGLIFPEL